MHNNPLIYIVVLPLFVLLSRLWSDKRKISLWRAMVHVLLAFLAIGLAGGLVAGALTESAPWSGNADECVIANMKGQDIRMVGLVRAYCEKKYPAQSAATDAPLSANEQRSVAPLVPDSEIPGTTNQAAVPEKFAPLTGSFHPDNASLTGQK